MIPSTLHPPSLKRINIDIISREERTHFGIERFVCKRERERDKEHQQYHNTIMASHHHQQPTPQQQMRRQIQNPISINDMRDGIVDEGTYSKYVNEIIPFRDWLHINLPSWMSQYCLEQYGSIIMLHEHEKKRDRQHRIKSSWMQLIKSAGQSENWQVSIYIILQWQAECNSSSCTMPLGAKWLDRSL